MMLSVRVATLGYTAAPLASVPRGEAMETESLLQKLFHHPSSFTIYTNFLGLGWALSPREHLSQVPELHYTELLRFSFTGTSLISLGW